MRAWHADGRALPGRRSLLAPVSESFAPAKRLGVALDAGLNVPNIRLNCNGMEITTEDGAVVKTGMLTKSTYAPFTFTP